ncbi:MAG: YceI family protein [Flavobacteriales bacterium]
MKKPINLIAVVALLPLSLSAQDRYATRNGHITFHSSTPVEDIKGDNHKVTSVFDAGSGAVEFAVLVKAFDFEKALMQEHFNENYMESNTYPKAMFKGTFSGQPSGALKPGTYDVVAKGDLTIHGVTKPVEHKGKLIVAENGSVKAESKFNVKPEDHDIAIPGVVRKNIAEVIEVTVSLDYQKM